MAAVNSASSAVDETAVRIDDPALEIVPKWLRTLSICVYKITSKHNHSRNQARDLESLLELF
jgi:hypothetical protein